MFLRKCRRFLDGKCFNLRGFRTPNLPIYADCSNHLNYQGQTFAVPYFWILALAYRYFWNVNCARTTAFIFDTRRMFLWKYQSFWVRKCLDLRRTRTANLWIHTECSYLWVLFVFIALPWEWWKYFILPDLLSYAYNNCTNRLFGGLAPGASFSKTN